MISKKFKNSNILSAAVEFLFDATITFFVYRYIIKHLSVSALGVWSLALSFTALTSVGSSGFASSAVKFVSKYFVQSNIQKVQKVIVTTVVTVFVFAVTLALIVRILLALFYKVILSDAEYSALRQIIDLVFASFIITSLARVFLSTLDGMNLIYLRSRIGIISKIIYAIINLILVPLYGLKGLAIAQVVLGFILLMISLWVLRKKLSVFKIQKQYIFDINTFKEIFNYGANFQITSLLQMLSDPLTRFYLKDIGGLSAVGLFEVIYKMFVQIRQLIVVVMNTYVPIVSKECEVESGKLKELYISFFGNVMVMSLIGMSILFPFLKLALEFFNVENIHLAILYAIIISISLYANLLAASGFIFNLGTGNIKLNTSSALVFVFVNVFASYFLGKIIGVTGVLIGWAMAHIISSGFLLLFFLKREKIYLTNLITLSDVLIHFFLTACLTGVLLIQANFNFINSLVFSLLIYLLFMILFIKGNNKPKNILLAIVNYSLK